MGMKRGGGRGQIAMEYLMVIAFAMLLVVPVVVFIAKDSGSQTAEVSVAQISQIARRIASGAERVYAFGEPTTLTIRVFMPKSVRNVTVSNKGVTFIINRNGVLSAVTEPVSMNLSGNLSGYAGLHRIRITAANNSVYLSEVTN